MDVSLNSPPDRLVLDTNTVLALWMFRDPVLAPLREAVEAGRLDLLTRPDALEELRRVLAYRQFAQPTEAQENLLEDYRRRCTVLDSGLAAPPGLPRCRDLDDQKFFEIAILGECRWLLSRDKALLRLGRHRRVRDGIRILTPEAWQLTLGAGG